MANDNLFNVGTPLSASDYLQLISFTNKREMDDDRLIKGLGTLTGVSTSALPSSGLEQTLRRYSTANDEEITAKIIYGMADGDYKTEREYVREYKRRKYPALYMEKALAEWRRTMGRKESASAEDRAVRDQEIQEEELTQKKKLWDLNVESKELSVKSSKSEANKKRNEKYAKRLANQIAVDAYDYVEQGMKKTTALQTAIAEARESYDSPWAESAFIMASEQFDKLVKDDKSTKEVYNTVSGDFQWMTESDIQAINKDNPGTIVPKSEAPVDPEQVNFSASGSAAKILGDPAILAEVGLDYETAALLLEEWSKDKSWLVRFTEIAPEHRKLYTEWRDTANEISKWWITPSNDSVEGRVLD
jgi:hypothetical protein